MMRLAQDSFLSFTAGSVSSLGVGWSKSNPERVTLRHPISWAMQTALSPSVNPPKSETVLSGTDWVVRTTGPSNLPAHILTASALSPWACTKVTAPRELASSCDGMSPSRSVR